jgi:hypothetical protein
VEFEVGIVSTNKNDPRVIKKKYNIPKTKNIVGTLATIEESGGKYPLIKIFFSSFLSAGVNTEEICSSPFSDDIG